MTWAQDRGGRGSGEFAAPAHPHFTTDEGNAMRYYRFEKASGGEWPADAPFQPGAIIRVPRSNSRRPGAQFNDETREWVSPVWVECADPTKAAR